MSHQPSTICFNGQPLSVPAGTSVSDLLRLAEVRTSLIAVEVNQQLVPRVRHAETFVKEGDTVEVVTLVGGG
jgi:sulfur carrier protein